MLFKIPIQTSLKQICIIEEQQQRWKLSTQVSFLTVNFSNAIVHIQHIQYPNVSKFHKIHTRLQDHSPLRKWSGKVNRNNVSGNLAVRINKIPRWWTNNEAGGCIIRRIRTPAAFQLWGQAIHRLFLRLSLPTSHPLSLFS